MDNRCLPPPSKNDATRKRSCFGQSLPHTISPLLLLDDNLETGEVVERAPLGSGGALLSPSRLVPLLYKSLLLDDLLDDAGSSPTGDTVDLDASEDEVLEGKGLAGDVGSGALDNGLDKE